MPHIFAGTVSGQANDDSHLSFFCPVTLFIFILFLLLKKVVSIDYGIGERFSGENLIVLMIRTVRKCQISEGKNSVCV